MNSLLARLFTELRGGYYVGLFVFHLTFLINFEIYQIKYHLTRVTVSVHDLGQKWVKIEGFGYKFRVL